MWRLPSVILRSPDRFRGDRRICVANAFKDKAKLTFYEGASLPDPDKLFNNGLEGKKWRTIDLFKDDKINESSLKALVRAAVDHNKAIFVALASHRERSRKLGHSS